ncbi:nucleotide exchange factor GrpE [Legionella nagasakiensis]|uniref:nucleotide exchange factor GrpE n=1 Tax=Legionella nagasakiensis TaxID=535290 RepID=UPI0010549692|nr:nucleotide exchange factor GrpE [Legionella nagasakiensis]
MSKKTTKDWQKVREENELQDEQGFDELLNPEEESESTGSALEHPSYLELEEKLTLAEQKAHEHWEKSVRALAELDNVRRRAERDVANAHRYGLEKFVHSLLPVIDSLEQALQLAAQEADSAMREGLELTMKLFLDSLQKYNVEPLDPQGMPFDPQFHEAMSMQESSDVSPNTVLAVFQKGYKLNDRVIRPARVIVAKGK